MRGHPDLAEVACPNLRLELVEADPPPDGNVPVCRISNIGSVGDEFGAKMYFGAVMSVKTELFFVW